MHLEALREAGYRIFHDVPCEGRNGKLQYRSRIVVGPTGVAAIEVKYSSKEERRAHGFEEHVVTYDDRQGLDLAMG